MSIQPHPTSHPKITLVNTHRKKKKRRSTGKLPVRGGLRRYQRETPGEEEIVLKIRVSSGLGRKKRETWAST